MKSQSMVEYGEPLRDMTHDLPTPVGTQVLIAIKHCGVCHSDIHIHDGYFSLGGENQLDVRSGRDLPFTLGHEIEGEVLAVGPEAAGVAIGDRRAVYPWMGCGSCEICLRGDEHLCSVTHHLGITVDGGYASHVLVPHPRYLIDFGEIDPALAGTYMCSGLTAFSALKKLGALGKGDQIMIVGLGGVGMMGLEFAKALLGISPLVSDIDAVKRETASAAGAGGVYDPSDPAVRKQILKETGGLAGVIDFVGSESSLKFAHGLVRKGGVVVISGLMGGQFEIPIPMFPLRALSIVGTFVGSLTEAHEMIALARSQKVSTIPLEKRALSEANSALDDLRGGRVVGRVVLTP